MFSREFPEFFYMAAIFEITIPPQLSKFLKTKTDPEI